MIDAGDDGFTLDDAEAIRAQRIVGLSIPALSPGDTVSDAEERYRKAKRIIPPLFTEDDNEDGIENWDDAREADRWRDLMDWPTMPTVAEAQAWQANRVAVAEYREWMRVYGQSGPQT